MEKLDVFSAYDQKLLKSLTRKSESEVFDILDKSHKLFLDREQWIPAEKRISILEKTASLIKEQREKLAMEAAQEGGKPLVDSLIEIDLSLIHISEPTRPY